jgi:hypothetical protein
MSSSTTVEHEENEDGPRVEKIMRRIAINHKMWKMLKW